ncbi:MAG TPA: hypothetical protein PKD52_09805 [Clostridiales bacterium]|nr:hypothetical protein [Clostridiales bacterium]
MALVYDPLLQRDVCLLIMMLIGLFYFKHRMKKLAARYRQENNEQKREGT